MAPDWCESLQQGLPRTRVFQLLWEPGPTQGPARPSSMVFLSPLPGIILAKAHMHLWSHCSITALTSALFVPEPSWEEELTSKNRGSEPVTAFTAFTAEPALTVCSPKYTAAALCH